MAYSVGDFQVIIQGVLPGNEIWSNTWSFKGAAGDADEDDVVTALNTFYGDLADNMSTVWTYEVATVRDLFLGNSRNAPFSGGGGVGAGAALPTSCAIRISLSDAFGTRGGPFICGWRTSVVDTGGTLLAADQAEIATALDDLNQNVTAVGSCVIGINRVAAEEVEAASEGRVGLRFDVIRKRANDILEQYSSVPLG